MPNPSEAKADIHSHRPMLQAIAYRMLGLLAEAEDAVLVGDRAVYAMALEISAGRIAAIHIVRNPDKLKRLSPEAARA